MKTSTLAAPLLLAALLSPAGASPAPEKDEVHEAAEDKARTVPGGAGKGVKACHEDIERFCKGVVPGEGRVGRCLQKNRAKLSKPCRTYAFHGGKEHALKALMEIDGYLIGVSTAAAPVAPAEAP